MRTHPVLRLVLPILALALVLAPLAANAQVRPRELREQMRPVYQQMLTDPQHLALTRQLGAAPRDPEVIDRYLKYLPLSPMLALEIDMEMNRYEFGIPLFIAQWHQRWIELHEQKARQMYGDAYVDRRLVQVFVDEEGVPAKATVGTNRNSAYNSSPSPDDYQGEVQVVVNPNNTNQIVSAANTWDTHCADGTQAAFYSSDGGVTWDYSCPPGAEGYSGMSCSGYVFGSDPALYWDDSGNVYLNYMLICYTGSYYYSMVVARSTNGGASWSGHGIIKNSWSTGDLEDKNFYIIDNNSGSPYYGRHYTCWDRNNDEKIAYSTNGGSSWTEVDLPTTSGNGTGSRYDLGCEMAVEDDGTVHVIYDTLSCLSNCNNEEMFYSRSTNGGASWSSPIEVRDFNLVAFSTNSCPDAQDDRCIGPFGSIDVDNTGGACDGYLYVTFSDFTSGDGNNSDVWMTRSTNDGASWSTPIKINDDGLSNRIQFHPFLVVDPTNGHVVVGWHDARNDSGNDAIDYFVARSTDCGLSFETNVQASQASSEFNNSTISYSNQNTTDNPNYNPNQYGEYMGVDARGGKAYLAWSDTRHFFPSYTTEPQEENVGFVVVDFGGGECDDDPDCDDGLYCNGAETCVSQTCQPGTPIDCSDGVSCTDDSCNEATDSCDNVPNDGLCDNGLYCDGSETCDALLGCQAGTAVDCDDGVACTVDSCNEGTDSCDNVPDNGFCDNGLFCDGAETCDPVLGCQAGSDPCPGLDCDEVNDECIGGPGAQLESGSVTVGGTAVTVNLTNTYLSPVVVATAQYASNTTPVVTRVSNVTATSFDVRLVNPSGGAVAAESVYYLVVEEGEWTIDGVAVEAQKYTSTVTDEASAGWVGEAQSYGQSYTTPVVLGQVMSENDAWTVFWCQGGARTDPPSASTLVTGKTVCEDTDITRLDETVGFVVFEAGHGTLGGVEYEAALGADTVAGVGNSPPYTYTFTTAFATAPTIAVMTMAGVDGNNGGWAYVHGSTVATTTTLYLSIDEDQIADTERSHTTEQVGYVAFAGPVVYPPAAECTDDPDCDDGLYCNGAETCVDSVCQAGTPVVCDDGVACTDDSCNEGTDSCDYVPNDGLCSNGLFCDGVETCDAVLGCLAGTAVDCDDGVACTVDSCNEGTDSCDNTPDDGACDNGLFCDGAETCDPVLGCQTGSDPCPGLECDEVNDECIGDTAKLEWGTVTVGGTAVTVNLTNTYTSPVVVTAIQYSANTTPVVTRVSNVTATSFDVRIQNPSDGSVASENVSYLVVEEGVWTIGGVNFEAQKYTSTVTDENNSWVGEAQSYGQSYTTPVVLGQVMSEVDADWSVFWCQGTARTNPPSATALVTGKTVCEDPDTARANETVGIVVIEAGHGTLSGVEYEAALGADTVQGVDNSPPYAYTFTTAFASAPTVAVVTMAGVDGGNGGWAQVHGSTMATATTLYLSIDEDQVGDTERAHITEQVGYVVFASSGVYP